MAKTFISYRHSEGEWVWGRLKPVLEAARLEVLIDAERFTAGRGFIAQMDASQAAAERDVLVMTEAFLDSDCCRQQMDPAIVRPAFPTGNVFPIRRDNAKRSTRQAEGAAASLPGAPPPKRSIVFGFRFRTEQRGDAT